MSCAAGRKRTMEEKKLRILMCGSRLNVGGGMVSVIKNYLGFPDWGGCSIRYVPTHIESNPLLLLLYFFQAWLRIMIKALRREIDVAYLHTAERGSFFRKAFLVRTLKKLGVKTVMHHHAAEFEEFYAALPARGKAFVNKTLETADLNIVLSERLIGMIADKAPKANIRVLYNAVKAPERNPYSGEGRNILFLGRLGERKGVYDLLCAVRALDEKLPEDIRFCLCGDGEIEKVRETSEQMGVAHRIAHVGWVDGAQKDAFMAGAMINVLPSYHEGLPMSILETMARGIPNISTAIASIPEVIDDGSSGLLIMPGDTHALAQALETLICDPELRMQMSARAWKRISDDFSLSAHIAKLKTYLQAL